SRTGLAASRSVASASCDRRAARGPSRRRKESGERSSPFTPHVDKGNVVFKLIRRSRIALPGRTAAAETRLDSIRRVPEVRYLDAHVRRSLLGLLQPRREPALLSVLHQRAGVVGAVVAFFLVLVLEQDAGIVFVFVGHAAYLCLSCSCSSFISSRNCRTACAMVSMYCSSR